MGRGVEWNCPHCTTVNKTDSSLFVPRYAAENEMWTERKCVNCKLESRIFAQMPTPKVVQGRLLDD
jgi:phage FluMu protein Com